MPLSLLWTFVKPYWRYGAWGLAVLTLVVGCRVRDSRLVASGVARGAAEARAHVVDSTLKAVRPQLARTDTLVVHDTLRVARIVPTVETLHDTVLTHLTDTVLVKQYVATSDSLAHACTELSHDCQAYRVNAEATIRALEAKLAVQVPGHSCVTPSLVSAAVGGGLGLVAGFFAHR